MTQTELHIQDAAEPVFFKGVELLIYILNVCPVGIYILLTLRSTARAQRNTHYEGTYNIPPKFLQFSIPV